MVLWEITLVTAYVLGLRKTYRLALRAQKRVLGNKYPRIRDFTQRKTRSVFTIALNVHKEIQRRDISARKSISNFFLRFLDRARPQANIRGPPTRNGQSRSSPSKVDDKSNQSKAVRLDDSVSSILSSRAEHTREPAGATWRSRISSGLKSRARPVMRPRPALSRYGLWWQPVRRQSGSFHSLPYTSFSLPSLATPSVPAVHVLQSGVGGGQQTVFRRDILRLMQGQGKY